MKKLNKKIMAEQYMERFVHYIEDNYGDIEDSDYKKLIKEAKKVITKFIKEYPYENDGYEEYVDDYDYFDYELLSTLKRDTTYLRDCCDD